MKQWVRRVLLVFFAAVFLVSAYFLADYFIKSYKQQGQFNELAAMVQQAKPIPIVRPSQSGGSQPEETQPQDALVAVEDPSTGETVYVLPEYAQLYELNPDLVGWISIEGTKINYPVMQTPDRTDYYLHRDFYGKESAHGCIYVREQCDVVTPSDNLTIYGHRMRDGSMFKGLLEYMDEDYYESHRYIEFNTLTQRHTYEILAVFKTVAISGGFYYHTFVNAGSEAEFDGFVGQCKELALYDTAVTAQYGDKLITLSTCEWSQTDGRLVVVAKRIA